MLTRTASVLLLAFAPFAPGLLPSPQEPTTFAATLEAAERALTKGDAGAARALVLRALERDAKSTRAWALRARVADKAGDADEALYSLHTQLRLALAQKAPKSELTALRERIVAADPNAAELFGMNAKFIARLEPLAAAYEKDNRPHSAIRVHRLILAIDSEHSASSVAIERLASSPDPSLAGDAKEKDLLADVSAEWIREFDAQHASWDTKASLERENYRTHTNAGYEVLVRSAEAMEQMNRFYRVFFDYGTPADKKSVPKIDLNIFKLRDEYLKLGIGPPVEWSGGHFTGDAVETYVEGNGFAGTTTTLFHEAAHQFVSLATRAAGWLNEGLASFFEGCRILPNGSVIMNLPATHRLFPLAQRMERGWMANAADGIPKEGESGEPDKAPTFRIVVENDYAWGPAWYAPTWGVVFFLYNFQDPVDGRFVYRKAFRQYVDESGGLQGRTAVAKFEETVLAQPAPPIRGVERKGAAELALPKTIDELDALWKSWTLELRDAEIGKLVRTRPYLNWARAALLAKDPVTAQEHFEKGLVAAPRDVELLAEFAELLAEQKNPDRGAKLALSALQVLERAQPVDTAAIARVDRLLGKLDPKRTTLDKLQAELAASAVALVAKYRAAERPMMVMDLAWRLGTDLGVAGLLGEYRAALSASGKSLALFELAYNERDLAGWDTGGNTSFKAAGTAIDAKFGAPAPGSFDYQILTLERVTGGDFTLECEVLAARGAATFAGLVFGKKDASNFHAFVLFPGEARAQTSQAADSAWVDLASFLGGGSTKTWRHNPVAADGASAASPAGPGAPGAPGAPGSGGQTAAARWRTLRIDVAGALVDCWVDGELIATQDFGAREVLAGNFGLLQGRGQASFRNIRFLARDPRDPGSAIEREVRIEKLKAGGQAVGGSWLGLAPPFPRVARWLQAPRTSWDELELAPQLLVLWSVDQNELIGVHEWLSALDAQYGKLGLAILAVCSPNDEARIDEYLKTRRFPGSVGVDERVKPGMGETHTAYSIAKFNLPRLVLLDIDGKVVWEGDPGFKIGSAWVPGGESFLDTPLRELFEKRQLEKLKTWSAAWAKTGAPALARGELAEAWPLMKEARALDGSVLPLARDVQVRAAALEALYADLPNQAAQLDKQGRTPALRVLVDWARVVKDPKDVARVAGPLKSLTENANATGWERALKLLDTWAPKIAQDPAQASELVARLQALKGAFVAELATDLAAAQSDPAELARRIAEAPARPRQWLARHLGW